MATTLPRSERLDRALNAALDPSYAFDNDIDHAEATRTTRNFVQGGHDFDPEDPPPLASTTPMPFSPYRIRPSLAMKRR